MAPIITLIRHGEGFHNVNNDYSIVDPTLTDEGKNQCNRVRDRFPHHANVSHILASPLYRAIETAFYSFRPAIDRGVKIMAMREVTEASADPCNSGHTSGEILAWAQPPLGLGGDYLDQQTFSWLPPYWSEKSAGLYEVTDSKLRLRALVARRIIHRVAMAAGDNSHIVVVSHQDFLSYLVNNYGAWSNAEYRSYHISDDDAATLVPINI
ncbi:hypothetical protein Daus18300_008539 [Diaporthe australafricana]|uniref:Phosphoglycerate mutase family protein n=1 Tax=Diaporthe australafricana TaxID=127596 RepID=A0ABR3WHZ5_9PEZI